MTLPQAIESIRPSVVQIQVLVKFPSGTTDLYSRPAEDSRAFLSGSGVLVTEKGYVVTARHVVHDIRSRQLPEPIGFKGTRQLLVGLAYPNLENFKSKGSSLSMRAGFALIEAEIVEEDEEHDLALLRLKTNPFTDHASLVRFAGEEIKYLRKAGTISSIARPADGDAIVISGYPSLSENILVSTSGNIASAWSFEQVAVRSGNAPSVTVPETVDEYLGDIHVNPGNSGGPVYSVRDAKLIGICVAYRGAPVLYQGSHEQAAIEGKYLVENSGVSAIVPAKYVSDLLKRNGL